MSNVLIRDVPELLVVTEQRSVDQAELEAWLPGAMGRVANSADRFGGVVESSALPYLLRDDSASAQVFIVIYDGNPNEGPTPVEVCAPIDPGADVVPDVAVRRLPAHREAYVRVSKETVESGRLGAVYPELESWIAEHGHVIVDPPRETYWTDFFAATATDEVFDVCFPIR